MAQPIPERKFRFTLARLRAIQPTEKTTAYHDTEQPRLMLRVNPSGTKVFYVVRKVNRKLTYVRLGGFPELTVDSARDAAQVWLARIAAGEDPVAQRKERRAEKTLGELWTLWLNGYAKPRKRASSVAEDSRQYKAHLERWAGRKLSSIGKADVVALHSKIGKENGHVAANRLLSLLGTMFNYAKTKLDIPVENPTVGVDRFAEFSRDRFLQPAELPRFFKAVEAQPQPWRDYFLLALWTGARRGNLMCWRWDEMDEAFTVWRIRHGKAKGKETILIPIAEPAAEILKRRRQETTGPWVFPSRDSKTGHVVMAQSAWEKVQEASGLTDLHAHDLRRSVGSYMAATGASLQIVGRLLGHKDQDSTLVYSRLSIEPVRAALDKAVAAIQAAAKPAEQ